MHSIDSQVFKIYLIVCILLYTFTNVSIRIKNEYEIALTTSLHRQSNGSSNICLTRPLYYIN